MRGGAGIGCVVNGAAGRELLFADAKPPQDERIAVIGAGPPASPTRRLVADRNSGDRVREGPSGRRQLPATPARRRCSRSVEAANEISLAQYIDSLVAACLHKGVNIKYWHRCHGQPAAAGAVRPHRDRDRQPLSSRLGPIVRGAALTWGIGRWPGLSLSDAREHTRLALS